MISCIVSLIYIEGGWNLVVNDNLSSIDYMLMYFIPKELKNSIYERADHFEFDLAKILRWERNL